MKSYFQNSIPLQERIQACFQGTQVPRHELVDKTTVECIIGEMYFHPEYKEQALIIFQENNGYCYKFIIKNC